LHPHEAVALERFPGADLVAHGGMSLIYRARDARTGNDVAIKLLRKELVDDPRVRERFEREREVLCTLRDPRVVQLIDAGIGKGGRPYLVLEWVHGTTLASLAAAAPLGLRRAVALTAAVVEALDAVHGAGVVHGDITSNNVLVVDGPGEGAVKLIDFGLCSPVHLDDGTVTMEVSGTPEYMAPEIACGHLPTVRTDLYAAGVLLYELVTGTLPFTAPTPSEVMWRQLIETPEPPSRRAPGAFIPPALDELVARALCKDPARRFHAAAGLARALAGLTLGDAPVPHPVNRVATTQPWLERPDEGWPLVLQLAALHDARHEPHKAQAAARLALAAAQRAGDATGVRQCAAFLARLGVAPKGALLER
jgi:serine/threonine-protein kinase